MKTQNNKWLMRGNLPYVLPVREREPNKIEAKKKEENRINKIYLIKIDQSFRRKIAVTLAVS